MITIDVVMTGSKDAIQARTATMFAEGESYAMAAPPIIENGAAAAYCASAMAARVGCPGHYVCVEHDEPKGHYRFAMVAGSWSF